MNKSVVALLWLLARVLRRLLKVTLVLTVLSVVILVLFVNFYSYSSLTRFVYSIEWLLKYTPLIQNGELVIPPVISLLFHHLHALKFLAAKASNAIYNDGYPDFAGKYHWNREELRQCTLQNEMFRGQESDWS
ncbi:hypothetical protein AAVH_12786 [Aphelenchoides avenae]|nr:hypothetical protein AAVH_12786 [Aphelenchus avenae]